MKHPVVIVGAGLAGVGAARQLPGSIVFEAKHHAGGHAYSHYQNGRYFDEGAHICHAKDPDWLAELHRNAGEVVRIEQSRIANYWYGQWLAYPVQNHLRDLPVADRIRALTEIVAAQAGPVRTPRHYEEWCQCQYGDFLTERFYRVYTDKYWRMPMHAMDIDWLAGRLLPSQVERIVQGAIAPMDEKQSVFSSFYYPARGGFFAFFKKFYEGVDVRSGHQVVRVDPAKRLITFASGMSAAYDHLISTMPLNELIRAMPEVPDELRKDAETLRHTQMLGVNLVVNKPAPVPYHWFYIYDHDIAVSRVKVMSNVIPGCHPPGKMVLQTELFRRDDEAMDVPSLMRQTACDMGRVLGFDPDQDVAAMDHVVVSHAYTIPTLGRQAAVDRICSWLEGHGIQSAGLYGRWKYLWSDQAYASGKEAAAKVTCV
jgi:protoporphyrinogen oxidase